MGRAVDTMFSVPENLREHLSGCLRYIQSHYCLSDALNLGPASEWISWSKEIDEDDFSDARRTK